MNEKTSYDEKFQKNVSATLYSFLSDEDKLQVQGLAKKYLFTFQELKIFIEHQVDTKMWGEQTALGFWKTYESKLNITSETLTSERVLPKELKDKIFGSLNIYVNELRSKLKSYNPQFDPHYIHQPKKVLNQMSPESKIVGPCPVASEKTVCCNLYTIDAVKNCGFSCSYCSIQTMFKDKDVFFDSEFKEKLTEIKLDSSKFYHFGTGQSSDALMWGNRNGVLDALCDFARKNENILVEFKTKSKNVEYFLNHEIPWNVVCSWSLNPQIIIEKEEHLTASLDERLSAALSVAQNGGKIGFHCHPMFYYESWEHDYKNVFAKITQSFDPRQVAFISFGTLTFPKPVINQIRKYPYKTKILQMPLVPNPEGKYSYTDEIKEKLFVTAYKCFAPWHENVFFYLCMEESRLWYKVFQRCYDSNSDFENDFGTKVLGKLRSSTK